MNIQVHGTKNWLMGFEIVGLFYLFFCMEWVYEDWNGCMRTRVACSQRGEARRRLIQTTVKRKNRFSYSQQITTTSKSDLLFAQPHWINASKDLLLSNESSLGSKLRDSKNELCWKDSTSKLSTWCTRVTRPMCRRRRSGGPANTGMLITGNPRD